MTYQIGLPNGSQLIPPKYWLLPDDLSKAITLKEASQNYFYSRNALIRQIKKGQIQGFKLNRKWYIIPTGLQKRYQP